VVEGGDALGEGCVHHAAPNGLNCARVHIDAYAIA
jgi:hypothetical protein